MGEKKYEAAFAAALKGQLRLIFSCPGNSEIKVESVSRELRRLGCTNVYDMSKNGGKNWRDDWCTEAEDAQVGIQWEFDHPDFINSASCKKEAKYMEKLIGDRTMKLIVKWPTKWCKGKAEVIAKALIAGVSPPEAERLTDKWIKDQIQNADIKQNQQVVDDFCFAGHVPVRLADGTSKRFDELVKGDQVALPPGSEAAVATVLCIIETRCKLGRCDLVELPGGVAATPYHPVRDLAAEGVWCFPAELGVVTNTACNAVFNCVLDVGHQLILGEVGTQVAAPMCGHGFSDARGCVGHPYFGTNRIIDDLRAIDNGAAWSAGHMTFAHGWLKRDNENDKVSGLFPARLLQSKKDVVDVTRVLASIPGGIDYEPLKAWAHSIKGWELGTVDPPKDRSKIMPADPNHGFKLCNKEKCWQCNYIQNINAIMDYNMTEGKKTVFMAIEGGGEGCKWERGFLEDSFGELCVACVS